MKKRNKKRLVAVGVIGSCAISATLISGAVLCRDNVPIVDFCPVASCMASVFGYEAGLRHQMNDLEHFERLQRYEDESAVEITVQNVRYQEGVKEVRYVVPKGYRMTTDENGKLIGVETHQNDELAEGQVYQEINEEVCYVLPVGYILTSDENGKLIGVKSCQSGAEVPYIVIDPIVEVVSSDRVIYDYLLTSEDQNTVNIYNANWSYVDGEFVNNVYQSAPKMKLKKD